MKILSFNYVKKNIKKFWGAKISPQVAKKQELNITKLFIANEVDILIRKYVKERNDKIFEHLCSLVYEYYLMIDYSSINDLANVDVNGSTWGETHRLKKGLTRQTRWSRRISIHIGVWEHHLGKVWNQHLTSKQLEYHNSKT